MAWSAAVRALGLGVFANALVHAQSEVRHPDAENLRDRAGTRYLARADSVTAAPELMALVRRLRSLRSQPVGTAEYGRIVDVSVRHGVVAVVDQGFYEVTLIDTASWTPTVIGQQGSGPLDFRTLIAVDVQARDRLQVFDMVLGLKTLAFGGMTAPRAVSVVPPRVAVWAACLRQRTPVVIAPSAMMPGSPDAAGEVEPLLAVLDSVGSPSSRFGDSYRSPNPLTRRMMSAAVMGCSTRGDVAIGFVSLPFVRVFAADGQLRHNIRLRDYTQGWSVERRDANGRLSIGLAAGTREASQSRRIVEVAPDIFAVQVATLRVERGSIATARLDTYLVSAQSGEGVFVGDHLPYLAASDGVPSFGFRDEPEPVLVRLVPR